MTQRPIILNGPMVRALLEGRKTQTRQVIKLGHRLPNFCGGRGDLADPTCWGWEDTENGDWITLEKDPGQRLGWRDLRAGHRAGDRLWVRETWAQSGLGWTRTNPLGKNHYRADPDHGWHDHWGPWRSPIHMPRRASRLTLTVTDVRVQRVQEISERDAVAEGVERWGDATWKDYQPNGVTHVTLNSRGSFKSLWDSLNAKRGLGWDANPWVAAITFEVNRCNIDQMEAGHDGG